MLYFSYGSNMSSLRLESRVPSARFVTVATLHRHQLRFHKRGRDGSAKCDATATGDQDHRILGVVFDICPSEKPLLDRKEGLGNGYEEKLVQLIAPDGRQLQALTYYATAIDPRLKPFHWYKEHVLRGAREHKLADDYIGIIVAVDSVDDPQPDRHQLELAIYT